MKYERIVRGAGHVAVTVAAAAAMLAAASAARAETLKSGEFAGESGHKVSGTVSVESDGSTATLRFSPDFAFDGAPDPKVAFGAGGYDPATLLGPLKGDTGEQVYEIPASLDLTAYNEVWIWCEEFAVPLGMARID